MGDSGCPPGEIPGAWKLGHLWRFRLAKIEAYETAQQVPNNFELAPGASALAAERGSIDSTLRTVVGQLVPCSTTLTFNVVDYRAL